jgi:hypothetical protein
VGVASQPILTEASRMLLFLAPGVHAARVRDDIVFLDTGSDAYFCLGGAGGLIRLENDATVEVALEGPATQLVEAGLLTRADPARRQTPPPKPRLAARPNLSGETPVSIQAAVAAMGVTWSVARHFPRLSFADLLRGPPPSPRVHEEPTPALLEAVAQFERLRPWLPLRGECLLRSYHLRRFLRARGLDALWMFGVRTWPFSAHCWLQVGATALDDDLERLAAYQPILAV